LASADDEEAQQSEAFCLSRPLHKYPGEVLAMPIENNQPQDYDDDCRRRATRIQEQVIQNYVHNHWSQQHKTEGYEPIHQQQRTAGELKRRDYPKVMRQYECANKLSRQS
jgi:hypothetical protein